MRDLSLQWRMQEQTNFLDFDLVKYIDPDEIYDGLENIGQISENKQKCPPAYYTSYENVDYKENYFEVHPIEVQEQCGKIETPIVSSESFDSNISSECDEFDGVFHNNEDLKIPRVSLTDDTSLLLPDTFENNIDSHDPVRSLVNGFSSNNEFPADVAKDSSKYNDIDEELAEKSLISPLNTKEVMEQIVPTKSNSENKNDYWIDSFFSDEYRYAGKLHISKKEDTQHNAESIDISNDSCGSSSQSKFPGQHGDIASSKIKQEPLVDVESSSGISTNRAEPSLTTLSQVVPQVMPTVSNEIVEINTTTDFDLIEIISSWILKVKNKKLPIYLTNFIFDILKSSEDHNNNQSSNAECLASSHVHSENSTNESNYLDAEMYHQYVPTEKEYSPHPSDNFKVLQSLEMGKPEPTSCFINYSQVKNESFEFLSDRIFTSVPMLSDKSPIIR